MSQYIFNLIIYNWKSLINNKFEQETIQDLWSLNYCTLIFLKKGYAQNVGNENNSLCQWPRLI